MIGSMMLIDLSGDSLVPGFIALFLFIMGYSLVLPAVLKVLLYLLQRFPLFHSLNQRMTLRGVQASLSRTSLAIIALTVAVSATVGVSIMIGSFRASVADWLEMTLQSDLYISARSEQSSHVESTLDPWWLEQIRALPGISSVSTGHHATVETMGLPVPMLVLEPGVHSARGFRFLSGDSSRIWQSFMKEDVILVSEPFAYHRQLKVGDVIPLKTGRSGIISIRIAGVFQDYSATQGMVVLPRRLYERYWDDRSISSIGLSLKPEADAATLKKQLEQWAANSSGPVVVRSNKEIRDFSLVIFDRTFAITHVLRVLVVIVAFVGVFSALMALFLEKSREFSILRATGFTPGRLRLLVLTQSALIGLLAGLLSLPLGWIMSNILIEVINQRSFGWTMQHHFISSIPLQAVLLAVIAAILAGLYPTWRISQVSIREGLSAL
jgi:putative ABC transport system permease protein